MTNQIVGSAFVATKTPSELDDWQINWATRGLGSDTISTSAWAVAAASDGALSDLGINTPSPGKTDTTTRVWLSNGIAGNSYLVTNTVTTSGGRELEESFIVDCTAQRLIGN
ncbi:MAG: hypothetical protein K8U57_08655 [Planctomycetes bacterium]|nr:hypothetical protein [Planctomycetota bacterium]